MDDLDAFDIRDYLRVELLPLRLVGVVWTMRWRVT